MSRNRAVGIDPETGVEVEVAYGYDGMISVPGYFFQVFDPGDPDKALVNEGFAAGISAERLRELMKKWKVNNVFV